LADRLEIRHREQTGNNFFENLHSVSWTSGSEKLAAVVHPSENYARRRRGDWLRRRR
jgi:hypothetical protein